MKILLILLSAFLLHAESTLSVGFGPYMQTQPYKKADPLLLPSPVVFLNYEILYVSWSRIGVYFLGGENWGASLMIQPRTYGFESSDAPILEGMSKRERSWEGGLSLAGKNAYGFAEIAYLHDLLNSTDRSLVRFEAGHTFETGAWSFTPTVMALWFSQGFNDYYYGVSEHEATAERPAYRADAGVNLAVESYIDYRINPQWSIFTNLRVDWFDATITQSPIVDQSTMISGLVSLLYHFDF